MTSRCPRWLCWGLLMTLVPLAAAQDAAAVKRLHERVNKPGVVPLEDARKTLEEIDKLAAGADKLDAEARGLLLAAELHAALAAGDAARAAAKLDELQAAQPDGRDVQRAAWMVAIASGDAPRAQATLDKIKAQDASKADVVARRAKRLKHVGHAAPDRALSAGDLTVNPARPEGRVVVLNVWRPDDKLAERHAQGLRELHRSLGKDAKLVIVDLPAGEAAADKSTAGANPWPAAKDARSLAEELGLTSGMAALVDSAGRIRALGAAAEPEFVYAVRAAIAEARGEFAVVAPRALAGEREGGAAGEISDREAVDGKPKGEPPQAEKEPPRVPEAQELLDRARLYLKTGKKTEAKKLLQELIEKYPDSWEAREAKRMGLV